MLSRILSALVALFYLAFNARYGGAASVWQTAIYLVLPLFCIWFGNAMGRYRGVTGSGVITQASPGCMVVAAGWMLLLLPVVLWGIVRYGMRASG